jgi:hypothetical protein
MPREPILCDDGTVSCTPRRAQCLSITVKGASSVDALAGLSVFPGSGLGDVSVSAVHGPPSSNQGARYVSPGPHRPLGTAFLRREPQQATIRKIPIDARMERL